MSQKVLGVGHCSLDAPRLARVVAQAGGIYTNVATGPAALDAIKKEDFALILPNRVIGSDQEAGLNLIKLVKADPALAAIPIMLVSGFADKQAEAIAAGAETGFGKASLETPAILKLLAKYID